MTTSPWRTSLVPAILATALLALSGCGGDDDKPSGGGGGGSDDAAALLEQAFTTEVESAEVSLTAEAELNGVDELDGPLSLTLEGPIANAARGQFPQLDWDIAVEGGGQNLAGGVTITEDNAFVEFGGQDYEVGTELFGQFKTAFEKQQADQPQDAGAALKQLGIEPAGWLEDPQVEDGDDIGGDSTRVVTGEVDIKAVVQDFADAAESPVMKQQLEGTGQVAPDVPELTDEQLSEIEEAIGDATLEVNVDEESFVRRVSLDVSFEVPEDQRKEADGLESGKVSLTYELPKVGIDPVIEAPADAQPLQQLLGAFGGGLGAPQ